MPRDLIAASAASLVAIIQPVAGDPRKLKPGELCRVLNSTPLGQVIDDRLLRKHRERAGTRIGYAKSIDLLRYAAWLTNERRRLLKASAERNVPRGTPSAFDAAWSAADAYDRKKANEGARNRKMSAARAEIGELPEVVDPKRKESCRFDLRKFCETYLPQTFGLAWSDDLLEVVRDLQAAVLAGTWVPRAMPRGGGKSTIGKAAVLWAVLYGHSRYAICIAANKELGQRLLGAIKKALLTNDLLLEDFPEACFPVRHIGNVANRCNGQTYQGESTLMTWGKSELVLATIPGADCSGAIITCSGMQGGIRGANINDRRPDFAFVDDPQTKASAKSKRQVEERLGIITADVRGLAGPDVSITIYAAVTVIYPGDVADQLLNPELNPEWAGKRYKLLYDFPTDWLEGTAGPGDEKIFHWKNYRQLRRESFQNGGKGEEATEYYAQNKEAMDLGGRVAWEDRKPPGCLTGLQNAMNIFFENEAVFFAEYQNEPKLSEDGEEFVDLRPEELLNRNDGIGGGLIPNTAKHLVAHIDVQHKLLVWGALACDRNIGGSFFRGTFPEQRLPYWSKREADPTLHDLYPKDKYTLFAAVEAGLTTLLRALKNRTWRRQDGTAQALEIVLVDWQEGKMKETIAKVCRLPEFLGWAIPSGGRGFRAKDAPMEKFKPRVGETLGFHWKHERDPDRGLVGAAVDVNFWKTHVAEALRTAAGNPGAIHFSGAEGQVQRLLADHCTAEVGKPVKDIRSGRVIVEWDEKPKRDNEHWDNLASCCAAASMKGCTVEAFARNERKRIKFADRGKGGR